MSMSVFDIFKIGMGPSSSHTMGPMIASGRFIDELHNRHFFDQTTEIKISLFGSLALTGMGHCTDKAVILGMAGYKPESIDTDVADKVFNAIKSSKKMMLAGSKPISFNYDTQLIFHFDKNPLQHPNGLGFHAIDGNGIIIITKNYLSIGGGVIVDSDEYDTDELCLSVKTAPRIPYPFKTAEELRSRCIKTKKAVYDLVLENEKIVSGEDFSLINKKLDTIWSIMEDSVKRGLNKTGVLPVSGIKRRAPEMYASLMKHPEAMMNDHFIIMDWVTTYAMAVNEENACGGRIITAPTNGGAGVVPATLMYYLRFIPNASQQGMRNFLLTAASIAMLYKMNASISGAEVGCQGEVGVACSMSSAALTAVQGGTIEQIENAAEIAMEHNLGMTCDPVDGLVQIPCIERNGIAAIKAIAASRLALRGQGAHQVSLDSVIETMYRTGLDIQSQYRETAQGGLAKFARKPD